ncbi:MAG: nucleotidyltransferase domain-containing protein [Phormidesmis sp.]
MMTSFEQIKDFSWAIAEKFQPEKIILFGSYAYGKPNQDSDVDLLVVLPFEGSPIHKAVEIRQSVRAPFSLDLMARTPQHLQERLEMGDFFIQEILQKGRVIYEANHARVGR